MRLGIALPIAVDPSEAFAPRYADVRTAALGAEAAGFDSVWVFDHLMIRFPDRPTTGFWEPWTILSAIAEATERVELGTLVMCVPFRNPGLLARMADALDEVSGGRLILGLGAGWHQPEFDAYGYPFDHLASRFEDGIEIIAPLLRAGAVTHEGQFSRAVDVAANPRGPRPAGPPILIGSKQPRMHALTAKWADAWNACWFGRPTGCRNSSTVCTRRWPPPGAIRPRSARRSGWWSPSRTSRRRPTSRSAPTTPSRAPPRRSPTTCGRTRRSASTT